MFISVIIPTLNEEKHIGALLSFLTNHSQNNRFEVIVVDGGSSDKTIPILQEFPSITVLQTKIASRAHQMNEGAQSALGDVLYFVHADTQLINSFVDDITDAVQEGYKCGCYRFKFSQPKNPLLHINGFFTRFPFQWCRGGDQTLFVTKDCFTELNGFDEAYVIMEDYDILDRILLKERLKIIPKSIFVSTRKYEKNSYMKVQLANMKAMKMYKRGEKPETIKAYYLNELT